ncbi:Endothelial differentiation-related factor 1, partial [Geodia barretti]
MAEGEWGEVTFKKRPMRAAEAKSQKALNQAQRKGQGIETSKKFTAATNKQHSAAKDTAKLDRETEQLRHDTVTLSLSRALQQARVAKTWSQKDLATVSSLPYPPFLLSLSISPSLPLLSFYFSLPSSSTIA